MTTCSRPLYEMLNAAINGGDAPMDWLFCSYAISGIGITGVGMFMALTVAVGLKNWTEGFTIPAVWLTLVAGVLVTFVPGALAAKFFGIIVAGLAFLFIGIWYWLSS